MTVEQDQVLGHVDAGRRDFLRNLLTAGAAVAAVPLMAEVSFGQPPRRGGKGKGGQGGKGKGRKGKGRMSSPAELAKKLIAEYDKDGDKALNETELVAALEGLRKQMRRGGKGKGGRGKGKGRGDG